MASLVFSHQRSGSTNALSFARSLRERGGVGEPFNSKSLGRNLPGWQDASYDELRAYVDSVLGDVDIAKHIYGEHSADIDALVAQSPMIDRIVVLYRSNYAAAALSFIVARRIGDYHRAPDAPLGSISIPNIRRLAKRLEENARTAKEISKRTGSPHSEYSYEYLFVDDEELRRMRARELLIDLFGESDVASGEQFDDSFNRYMSRNNRYNSASSFANISNISEISVEFPGILD